MKIPESKPVVLKHHVHFYCPADRIWPELRSPEFRPIDEESLARQSVMILDNWVLRPYYNLRLQGEAVSLSDRFRPEAINIAPVRDLGRRARDPMAFVVIPRGDAHRPMLANFCIEQNFQRPPGPARASITHWPQPGLLPRPASRAARIEKLTFKGQIVNLDAVFRGQTFRDALSALGITLEMDAIAGQRGAHRWHDYRDSDVVLAVRNMTLADARGKPASKLINAWIAEVAALLGPEPAFRELRRSDLDFIEIRTPEDALGALKDLKDNPSRYLAMIENGRARREEFTEARLTARWIELLNGPIAEAFERWQRKSAAERMLRYGAMCLLEPLSKKIYRRRIHSGKRLFDT